MNRENTPTKAGSPITVLTIVMVMTWAVLAALGWLSYRSYRNAKATTQRHLRIEELRGAIIHLDEVLTMSARMAAATGELQWEDRYRRFEPQLDAAIKEAMRLAPEAYSGEAAAETDAANIKLVAMENRAFDLVRQGRAEEAKAVLFSDEYKSQKQVYAQGMDAFAAGLANSVSTTLKWEQRLSFLQTGAMLLPMPFLIVGWVVVFRAVCNWKTTLGKQAEEALRESEERFKTMFEEAPLGVALIDSLTGRICEVNPRFAEIAGRTRETMATIDWMSITHPDDVQEGLDNMAWKSSRFSARPARFFPR